MNYQNAILFQKLFLELVSAGRDLEWFHGTTLANATSIQAAGLSNIPFGTNGGSNLGNAFYVSNSINEAMKYTTVSPSSYGHNTANAPTGAILVYTLKNYAGVLLDDNSSHAKRMEQIKKEPDFTTMHDWASKNNISAYGFMGFPRNDFRIKLAVYDTRILELKHVLEVK
ncbi:hypothetical protein ACFFSY_29540 [Paenibacillus aurantiacus]|uniref:PARP catalytic domain-containing protein n=1 Tax=Paenibacillus aurantiacus TaxID=1936118 RepID=A0ABV5KY13_9BACL